MKRNLFGLVAALVVTALVATYQNQAAAQEKQKNDAASANAGASQSNSGAPAQANQSASGQAGAQGTTSGQATANTNAGGQSTATQGSANQQKRGDSGPSLPPPESRSAGKQPQEQSLLDRNRQTNKPGAAATDRGRADVSVQGRGNVNAQARVGAQADVRSGIQFGRATDRGLAVSNVDRNSFFFRSGLRNGDVIVSLHGRAIRSEDDFLRFVVLYPGLRVPVVVLRDGRYETIFVEYPVDIAHTERFYNGPMPSGGAYLGVVFDTQYRDAVVIASVNRGSPAEQAGLQPGDMILALNGRDVRSYPDAVTLIRSMRPGEQLEIVVERARAERQLVAVLDAQPEVRTATRPDVYIDREPVYPPVEGRIDVDRRYYDRPYDRSYDRNRNYDNRSRRGILPRMRD